MLGRARMARSSDVIVIGAGVAGLSAALDPSARGVRVDVIEPRDRVGGRVHTLTRPGSPPIEVGADFIDVPGAAWDVLRAAGKLAVRSAGGMWEVARERARPLDMRDPHAPPPGKTCRRASKLSA
jgi:monoamine oxidase